MFLQTNRHKKSMATQLISLVFFCIQLLSTVTSGASLTLIGSASYAVLDQTFRFTCTLTDDSSTEGILTFNKVRQSASCAVIVSTASSNPCTQAGGGTDYTCGCVSGQTGVYYMNISRVEVTQDEATWRCQRLTSNSNNINLPVYYPPNISTSFPNNKDVTENSSPDIDCSSGLRAGNPSDTSYTWTGPGGYNKSGSVLDRRVSRSQGGSYTCTARNSAGLSDSAQVNINVQFAPEISSSFPKNKNMTENSTPNIDCSSGLTAGNPSDTSYTWTAPGGYSKSGSVLDRRVSRSQGGSYTCTARNSARLSDSAQVNINVQFLDRPIFTIDETEVRENERVKLRCSAQSNPTALLTVRNVDNDTVVVQKETDVLTYTIPRAQCLHNGSFICSGENKEMGILYSLTMQLNVVCSPRLDTRKPLKQNVSSGLDEIVSLLLNVISNPAPTFRWYLSDNQQLVPIPNVTKHEVISTAKYSVLQIHVSNIRDYASYVVEATSNHETFKTTFNLLPASEGSSSKTIQSDRFGIGIGIGIAIGIAAVVPVVAIGIVVYVCMKRRNTPTTKGPGINHEVEINMSSVHENDTGGTYSDLTSTPKNEYEELKVKRY